MSDSRAEVAQTVSTGFRYKFDCAKRTVVSVRNSDNFEFDRRAMTRDEANKHCGKEADDLMNQKLKERAEAHLNEEHGAPTIKALAGQNEKTKAWTVSANRKCGRTVRPKGATPPADRPVASVKRRGPGKKSRLEDPPAQELKPPPSEPPQPAEKTDGYESINHVWRSGVLYSETTERAYHINNDTSPYQTQARVESNPKPIPPEEMFPPRELRLDPSWFGWRGALAEEALLLRKTAVAILAGKVDPAELVKRLREQADKLDEIVYAEA